MQIQQAEEITRIISYAPDNAGPTENFPSDFRIVQAAGVFSGFRLPV